MKIITSVNDGSIFIALLVSAMRKTGLAAPALALILAGTAYADTTETTWGGGTDSTWSNAANWGAAGVPTSTISAEFNPTTAYTNQPPWRPMQRPRASGSPGRVARACSPPSAPYRVQIS